MTPCEVIPAKELLGDLYFALQDFENALTAYEDDLKDHPMRFNGLVGAGMSAKELNDNTKARIYFLRVLDIEPLNVKAHSRLGMILSCSRLSFFDAPFQSKPRRIS